MTGHNAAGVASASHASALVTPLLQNAHAPQPPEQKQQHGGVPEAFGDTQAEGYKQVSFSDIAREFSLMGYTAFGGPSAHIGLFQRRLVQAQRWVSDELFLELFGLCGSLPGPTSTEVSFALGAVKGGTLGGLLSGILFQYPGAFIMTGVGIASASYLKDPPAWLEGCVSGVSAVGVALVASAAKNLIFNTANQPVKAYANALMAVVCCSAAAAIYWTTNPWLFPGLIAAGGLYMMVFNWNKDMALKGEVDEGISGSVGSRRIAILLFIFWMATLIPVCVLVRTLEYDHRRDSTPLDWFEVFYRIGSIVHGGGQSVLPMLLGDLVKYKCDDSVPPTCVEDRETSWVTTQQFYTGLGLVQAMPGPLFNFSAYLGAIIAHNSGYNVFMGAAIAWVGLFGPGILLVFACLPFWKRFRTWQVYRRALPGMNAASTGLILASVFRMTLDVYALSPFPKAALCIGLFAFLAVDFLKLFEGLAVICGIALGALAWRLGAK